MSIISLFLTYVKYWWNFPYIRIRHDVCFVCWSVVRTEINKNGIDKIIIICIIIICNIHLVYVNHIVIYMGLIVAECSLLKKGNHSNE